MFKPEKINSLDDLPKSIKDTLRSFIQRKVGDRLYVRIKFTDGRIINDKEPTSQDPQMKQRTVRSYDLGFSVHLRSIGYYCSRLRIDSNGEVLEMKGDFKFPDYKLNPNNYRFKALSVLKKTAQQNGFTSNKYSISFSNEHIVLIFTKVRKDELIERLEISVHTGEVIKRSSAHITVF